MIRFLFVILAVVAAVLAALFDNGWLYLVAAALLLVAGVLVLVHLRSEYRREHAPYSSSSRPSPAGPVSESDPGAFRQEELNRAGILEVRPKLGEAAAQAVAQRSAQRDPNAADGSGPRVRFSPSERAQKSQSSPRVRRGSEPVTSSTPAEATGPGRVTSMYNHPADKGSPPNVAAALKPYLTALHTALGAHTVCLIRVDVDASRYRMTSIISRSPHVIPDATFAFRDYFLSKLTAEPSLLEMGTNGFGIDDLGYYREPVPVRQVAIVPVQHNDEVTAFLLADVLEQDDPLSDDAYALLNEASDMLGRLLSMPSVPVLPTRTYGPRLRLVEVGRHSPNRDIIAEEMAKARRDQHPLALALVYLYYDLASYLDGESRSVEHVEQEFLRTLRALTPDGRVERFGDMGYGVFHYTDVDHIAGWVEDAQQALHDPDRAGRLSIGVALLSDRHRNPDDFQIDAARALREAYETGESTILVE